jgi:hypothetical protein
MSLDKEALAGDPRRTREGDLQNPYAALTHFIDARTFNSGK